MDYVIFSKPQCPFCIKAVKLLEDRDKNFKVVNFNDNQQDVLDELKDALKWPTVPIVFYREGSTLEFIGGYTDLMKRIEDD
tara:strand:- start:333 stop:575 length:243 start_codon:yes stop_codon:yes gene_type:complete